MLFKKKETILNVKDGLGRIIAIINKRSFKYVFFNKANKKNKVRICIEGNHFIDIKVDTEEQAIKIINKIKEDMCVGN